MSIFVTGGAGFVGYHLCRELLARGRAVTIYDNLSTGSSQHVDALKQDPRCHFIEGDVRDAAALRAALAQATEQDGRPEMVFHLAAAVGVRTILERPLESLEVNLRGTDNVLAAVAGWGGRVLLASTSEVYGKNPAAALSEESDRLIGAGEVARWWYAIAKMADEGLALAAHREGRLRAVVVRLFNTVGPRQTGRYGMVLPTLVAQALASQPLTVFGDGEQTRCFTYIADTVRALIELADAEHAYGRIYNIGQPEEISINKLARRVLELTGSTSTIVHVPYETAYGGSYEDMRRRVPDCSRLEQTIGFAPGNRLDEAILAVAEDQRGGALGPIYPAPAAAR
ncbi:MAG TPA: SDR family NAD(P)-dependent oxidoreductase [Chloroflexota bacterium]|nr:SDR family NAD(P)-dependent oxidoreductase [Chloroflexota bacterium]